MMLVRNTENNRQIRRIVASMAIEEMYFDKNFIKELMKIDNNKKSSKDLIQKVIDGYV